MAEHVQHGQPSQTASSELVGGSAAASALTFAGVAPTADVFEFMSDPVVNAEMACLRQVFFTH